MTGNLAHAVLMHYTRPMTHTKSRDLGGGDWTVTEVTSDSLADAMAKAAVIVAEFQAMRIPPLFRVFHNICDESPTHQILLIKEQS